MSVMLRRGEVLLLLRSYWLGSSTNLRIELMFVGHGNWKGDEEKVPKNGGAHTPTKSHGEAQKWAKKL